MNNAAASNTTRIEIHTGATAAHSLSWRVVDRDGREIVRGTSRQWIDARGWGPEVAP